MNIKRKPRIWYEFGLWLCSIDRVYISGTNRVVGVGENPIDALTAWREGTM